MADVLTADLSEPDDVSLLERDQIDRVLDEQKLQAAGFTLADTQQVGRLLHADGLLLVSQAKLGDQTVLITRMIAVHPGVVLWSLHHPWPVSKPDGWSREVRMRVRATLDKLRVPRAAAIPVSVLNLRWATDSKESQSKEQTLTLLLQHRLVRQPQVYVLERQQMELLLWEKVLGGETNEFWSSRYLLDGSVEPRNAQEVVARVRLQRSGHGAPIRLEVEGKAQDLPALADAITRRVIEALGHQPAVGDWDLKAEAEQFFEEAKWADACGLSGKIVRQIAEASWVLGLRSAELTRMRILCLAREIVPEGTRLDSVVWDWTVDAGKRVPIREDPATDPSARPPYLLEHAREMLQLFLDGFPQLSGAERQQRDDRVWEVADKVLVTAMLTLQYVHQEGGWDRYRDLRQPVQEMIRRAVKTMMAYEIPEPGVFTEDRYLSRNLYYMMSVAAPYWYETVEDVLNAYRVALAKDFHSFRAAVRLRIRGLFVKGRGSIPYYFPLDGAPRARADSLWRAFVEELCCSERLDDRLTGWTLKMKALPAGEAKEAIRRQMRDEFWNARDLVTREKISYYYMNFCDLDLPGDQQDAFDDFRLEYLIAVAPKNHNMEGGVLSVIESRRAFTEDQVRRAHEALLAYERNLANKPESWRWRIAYVQELHAKLLKRFPSLMPSPESSPLDSIPLKRFWHPHIDDLRAYDVNGADSIGRYTFRWQENRLWFAGCSSIRGKSNLYYVASVEPDSLQTERHFAVDFFKDFNAVWPGPGFALTPTAFYLGLADDVLQYDRKRRKWSRLCKVDGRISSLEVVADRLFACTGSALMEINPETGAMQILASARRRPAASPLDRPDVSIRRIGPLNDAELFVQPYDDNLYGWHVRERRWRVLPATEWLENTEPQWVVPGTKQMASPTLYGWAAIKPGEVTEPSSLHSGLRTVKIHHPEHGTTTTIPLRLERDPAFDYRNVGYRIKSFEHLKASVGRGSLPARWTPKGLLVVDNHVGGWFIPIQEIQDIMARQADAAAVTPRGVQPENLCPRAGLGQIAFVSTRHGGHDLFLMDEDGTRQTRLTWDWTDCEYPAWSPDGRQLIFVARRRDTTDLLVMDLDTLKVRNLTNTWLTEEGRPAWSPDGRTIAFGARLRGQSDIWLIDADGTHLRQLTNDPEPDSWPTWSPDGSQIAFQSSHDKDPAIYVVNADGRARRRLTELPGEERNPAWSPDGRQIAFVYENTQQWDARHLMLMNADGTHSRVISPDVRDEYPSWSPDGQRLVVRSWGRHGKVDIYVMDVEGQNVRRLTDTPGENMHPAWRPLPLPTRDPQGADSPL